MLDEEYVKREKRAAKGYKEYLAKRPEFKKDGKASTFVAK